MVANLGERVNLANWLHPTLFYLKRPLRLFQSYDRADLRSDLIAAITVAVIALPQGIAFAVIAELPPQMGIYATVVGGIIGALWGSSNQVQNGPANAVSLLVAASLVKTASPGTQTFLLAAGVLAVMVGVFQLLLGLFRLGILVNFVSHSVIIGFAAGAGILIVIKQLSPLLGVHFSTANPLVAAQGFIASFPNIHLLSVIIGIGTMMIVILLPRVNQKIPGPLAGIILASVAVFVFNLDDAGVALIGEMPRSFPPFVALPLFDFDLVSRLAAGAVAVGAIGLVQTTAIARSISAQTGQRLDSNQEFVSQGIANIFAGFFSGYACAASFSRTAVNYKTGAKTPFSSIFSSIFVLIAVLALAPLTAYLPIAALADVIIPIAYGLVDRVEIARIWKGAKGDAVIMVITLLGSLFLDIQFAVLLGIMLSLVLYILRTSTPRVHAVMPDSNYKHFVHRTDADPCPQLGVIDILGDLYFGAVNHVEELILAQAEQHPEQRFLLIRMSHVNHCDFSGIHMLESVVRAYRERGGDVYLVRVSKPVVQLMESTGFDKMLGFEHFLDEDEAIDYLFHRILDPVICIYECPLRVFKECRNLPKQIDIVGIPHEDDVPPDHIFSLTSQELWRLMHADTAVKAPYVVDVRESREFKRGHVPDSHSVPLSTILLDTVKFPGDRQIVIVCRSSRRSRRAAHALQHMGIMNVAILEGGLLAWEAAGLLEAIDTFKNE